MHCSAKKHGNFQISYLFFTNFISPKPNFTKFFSKIEKKSSRPNMNIVKLSIYGLNEIHEDWHP